MARGSSGRAARRGGRVAVPTKRALQSGVTDDTSNKKQAVGGGGAGPSSAPVSLTPAEGAPADGQLPVAEGAPADGQQLDVRMIATVAVIQWFIMIAHVLAAVPTDRCALISTLYEQLRPQKKRFYYTRRGGLIYPQGSHWRSLCAQRDERSFMHFLGVDPNTFDVILARFEPIYGLTITSQKASTRGRMRLMTPTDVLAMTLVFLRTGCGHKHLQEEFGAGPAVVSRELRVGLRSLHSALRGWKDAEILWPSAEQMAEYAEMISHRHSDLQHCFGFVDGTMHLYPRGWLGLCLARSLTAPMHRSERADSTSTGPWRAGCLLQPMVRFSASLLRACFFVPCSTADARPLK
jgi:hypothetical protein